MIDPLSNRYVNWTDGMKISQHHFHQLQRTIEEKFKDGNALLTAIDDYGILPEGHAGKKPVEYLIRIEGKATIHAEIIQCRGLTPSGDRIEILASETHSGKPTLVSKLELEHSAIKNGGSFFLCVRYRMQDMVPFGKPVPDESPARLPYASPELRLELIPESDNINAYRNALPIARFVLQNDEIRHDQDYIPPCRQMRSHDDLKEFGFKYVQFLTELDNNAFEIVRNLGRKESLTKLAQSVGTIARSAIQNIELHLDFLEMNSDIAKPSLFVLNAKQLARCLRNAIELLPNEDKEELLNYLQEVIDVGPGEYMTINNKVVSLEYDHLDIKAALNNILQFCKVNGKLFNEWSNLDYIGKKKKTGIFVGEVTKDTEVTKERKKWDF
jgi:hypothetical protein